MRRLIWAGLCFCLLAGALSAPATAGETIPTRLTIHYYPGEPKSPGQPKRVAAIGGLVKGDSHEADPCFGDRKVVLYRKARPNAGPKKVETAISASVGSFGTWSIEHTPVSPIYFAKLKAVDVPEGTCGGDTSKELHIST